MSTEEVPLIKKTHKVTIIFNYRQHGKWNEQGKKL